MKNTYKTKKTGRAFKNVIMVLMIVAIGVGSYFTMDYAKNDTQTSTTQVQMQMPSGDMQGADSSSESQSTDSNSQSAQTTSTGGDNSSNQPPEMPSGETGSDSSNQPSEMPSGDNSSDSSNQPPEMPSGDSGSDSSNQPPEMPSGDNSSDSSNQPPEMPSGENGSSSSNQPPEMTNAQQSSSSNKLSTKYYVLFACESLLISLLLLYLIMSHFNKKSFKETFRSSDKVLIYLLSLIIATSALTVGHTAIAQKLSADNSTSQSQQMPGGQNSSSDVSASGATTVDGEDETLNGTYTSTTSDESPILVTNGANATISGATVDKKSGDSSSTESSEFSGVNAGILVQENSSATIKNAKISTNASGSNAVFSTGENSKIYISDSTITTSAERSSRGLDATYGGYIEADNVTITTQGGSCATLATDRGEGTVIANNSTLETNGAGSPIIYSTGDISIDNTVGTANGSQNVVIEGKNSATITNSTLKASGAGNRGDVDVAGVMIYQSMSGDASEGKGTFTAKDSSLSVMSNSDYYKSAPMFFVTNTDAEINLTNTKLSFGSGVLLNAKGTSEWGNEGSNGGNVTLNATNQTLKGNIEVDNISTAKISLTKSSYEGTINGDNSAKEISLSLDKDSTITLTGDSYVTSLENADTTNSNINFNGYKLYVNGKAIN
ncbi:MAG: hypothetical protein IJR70_07990 [Eubacterium sp.]|nr:hypothetical protein [Eubacterium sp.]